MNSFGFIITRHVNSHATNKYWNHSIKLLKKFYPERRIIIIDDNSNKEFLKPEFDNNYNIEVINSDFPGRGELLPYYYYIQNHFFDNAIILHDSVFIHKRINFNKLNGIKVLPLWHFFPDNENVYNSIKITEKLSNPYRLQNNLNNTFNMGMPNEKWYGCFGVQTYINRHFLLQIERKYNITNMISVVLSRPDRCCLERIMGCIFYNEYPQINGIKSLFGNITMREGWRKYTFEKYMAHLKKGTIPNAVIKVWTGR
jgi:hypothetical protein